jgi:hypothetical protein
MPPTSRTRWTRLFTPLAVAALFVEPARAAASTEPVDPTAALVQLDAAKATVKTNADIATKARERLETLSVQRKALEDALRTAQKDLDQHFRAAIRSAPPTPLSSSSSSSTGKLKKPKKPSPTVDAYRTGKAEYAAAAAAGRTLIEKRTELVHLWDESGRQITASADASAKAKAADKEAHDAATLVAGAASKAKARALKDPNDPANKAAAALVARAAEAKTAATEAHQAATTAAKDATKVKTLSGLTSATALATKKASVAKAELAVRDELATAKKTSSEIDTTLSQEYPAVKG